MYLNIGNEVILSIGKIIAIIGWSENDVKENDININFIKMINKKGKINNITKEKIKTLILADDDKVYLSSVSKQTLTKRSIRNVYSGGENKID